MLVDVTTACGCGALLRASETFYEVLVRDTVDRLSSLFGSFTAIEFDFCDCNAFNLKHLALLVVRSTSSIIIVLEPRLGRLPVTVRLGVSGSESTQLEPLSCQWAHWHWHRDWPGTGSRRNLKCQCRAC